MGYLSVPAGVEWRRAMGKCGMLIWLIRFQTEEWSDLKKTWYTEEDELFSISPQQGWIISHLRVLEWTSGCRENYISLSVGFWTFDLVVVVGFCSLRCQCLYLRGQRTNWVIERR